MEYKDYYKILGVAKNATEKEIKSTYRQLARQFHPDRNPGDKAAEEKFKEINEAYEVLGDKDNRAKYDQLGQNYHRFRQMGGDPGQFDFSQFFSRGGPGVQYQQTGQGVNFDDLFGGGGGFSDFFNAVFGAQRARPAQPVTGRDIQHEVEITLEEAFHGTERILVRDDGERFTARIPRGARTGTKIRLRGKGGAGPAGPGDLFLLVKVKRHPIFRRDGHNLRTDLPVDLLTAVLGGKVRVSTLAGPVNLTIRPGTQGGQTIRLTGKGMPHLKDKERAGDLLVRIQIRVPKSVSDEERAHYEALAALKPPETAA